MVGKSETTIAEMAVGQKGFIASRSVRGHDLDISAASNATVYLNRGGDKWLLPIERTSSKVWQVKNHKFMWRTLTVVDPIMLDHFTSRNFASRDD